MENLYFPHDFQSLRIYSLLEHLEYEYYIMQFLDNIV